MVFSIVLFFSFRMKTGLLIIFFIFWLVWLDVGVCFQFCLHLSVLPKVCISVEIYRKPASIFLLDGSKNDTILGFNKKKSALDLDISNFSVLDISRWKH